MFYLDFDISNGLARSKLLPDKHKNGCLSYLIDPAYQRLDDINLLLIEAAIVLLISVIFVFASCTPYDKTRRGKLYALEDIDESVVEE